MKDRLPPAFPICPTSRRTFLRETSRGAATAVAAPVLLSRLGAAITNPTASGASTGAGDNPLFMSATKLAGLIRARKISSVEVVRLCLERIEQVNPRIHAVVTVCRERALAEAAEADAALAGGRSVGALHGVPMTMADVLDTAGIVSTGGTPGQREHVPAGDATVVARLRAAGAILLGKSNTSELGLDDGPATTNPVFGPTRNPFDPVRVPGGPAGGAGAIVAAGGAAFDIGSGTDGALRRAAAANGIAGLKATCGLLPRTGHILNRGALYDSLLQLGPLARRVEDLALLLPILAGPDDQDAMVVPVPLGDHAAVALKNLRVAFYTQPGSGLPRVSSEIAELVKRCASHFAELGCRVVEEAPPRMAELFAKTRIARGAAGGADLRRLFQAHGANAEPLLPETQGPEIPSPDYTLALLEMDALKSEQLAWVEHFDLLVGPASAGVPPRADRVSSDPGSAGHGADLDPYAINGWPAGVVRAGSSREALGLPLGVQVAGQPWHDHEVLAALAFLEERTGGWQPPAL